MDPGPAGIAQLEYILSRLICVSVPIGFIALLVILVIAGIKYLTSGGEPKAVTSAHQTATWGLLGVLFLAIAWLILQLIQTFTGVEVTKFSLSSIPGVQGFTGSCWESPPVAPEPPKPQITTSSTNQRGSPTEIGKLKTCSDYPDNKITYFDNCQEIELPYLKYKSAICWADCNILKPYLVNYQILLDNPNTSDPLPKAQKESTKKLYSTWRTVLKDGAQIIGFYDVDNVCEAGSTGGEGNTLIYEDPRYRPPYSDPGTIYYSVKKPNPATLHKIQVSKSFMPYNNLFFFDPDNINFMSTPGYIEDIDKKGVLGSDLFIKFPKGFVPLQSYEVAVANDIETSYPPANYTTFSNPTPSQFQDALDQTRRYVAWREALLGLACDDGNYYRATSLTPQKLK